MAITLDQGNIGTAQATGATSLNLTTTHAVPAGGFITVGIQNYGASSGTNVTGITDNSGLGLAWVEDAAAQWSANTNVAVRLWRANCPSGLPSGTVITISLDAASNVEAGATSWAAGAPVAVDTAVTNPNAGPTAWTTGNMTIQADSVIVAATGEGWASTDASTPTSPSVELIDFAASGVGELTVCYRAPGAAGTYSVAGSFAANMHGFSATAGVAYKLAGTTYTDTPSGTITLSGSLVESHTVSDSATGTINLSGSLAESHTVADSMSGTITVSGSLTEGYTPPGTTFSDTPSGTITLSGSLVESHSVSTSPSGAISLSGSLAETETYTDPHTGTLTLSGSLTESHTTSDIVSGSMTLSGALVETHAGANDFTLAPATDGNPSMNSASSIDLGALATSSDGSVLLTPVSDTNL